jgi:hypothetical protein
MVLEYYKEKDHGQVILLCGHCTLYVSVFISKTQSTNLQFLGIEAGLSVTLGVQHLIMTLQCYVLTGNGSSKWIGESCPLV